jgi:hypothetical protein
MFSHSSPHFPHRRNWDGSYDSICIACHLTVAKTRDEADLASHEHNHACDPARVHEIGQYGAGAGAGALRR